MKMNLDEIIKIIANCTTCRDCRFADECSVEKSHNRAYICDQAIDFLEKLKKSSKEE